MMIFYYSVWCRFDHFHNETTISLTHKSEINFNPFCANFEAVFGLLTTLSFSFELEH